MGKSVLEDRSDSRLERGAAIGHQRPIREGRELDDLVRVSLLLMTRPQRHDTTNGTSGISVITANKTPPVPPYSRRASATRLGIVARLRGL